MPITTTYDHLFYPGDLLGLIALDKLAALAGDVTLGDAAAVGEFSAATAAPVSTMLADATAFWTTGVADALAATPKTGFSSATPYEFFESFRSDVSAAGTWRYADGAGQTGTTITGRNWAGGVRAWQAHAGYDAKVADVWGYLMGFSSNPTLEAPASYSPLQIAQSRVGTFDPTLCLTTTLYVAGAQARQNASDYYDWACAGLMAATQASQSAAKIETAKNTVAKLRERDGSAFTYGKSQLDNIVLLGTSGLSFQTGYADIAARTIDCAGAAMCGNLYRQSPKAFNMPLHGTPEP